MKKMIITLTIVMCGQFALAQSRVEIPKEWVPGRFYYLSPALAGQLGLNYSQLIKNLRVEEGGVIIASTDEKRTELNISIFDSAAFSEAVMDLTR